MYDINKEDNGILSIFDASREFDADFIKSFVSLISQSTTGFHETEIYEINEVIHKGTNNLPTEYKSRLRLL